MTYRLYDFLPSGNGYKVRLLLTQLGLVFDYFEIDIMQKQSRTPEFLQKNPNGRIPVLEIEPGVFLSESNAILNYLAEGTAFLPSDRLDRTRVLQWMFFEQYSHEPYIATSRFWLQHGMAEEKQEALAEKQAPGYAALDVLENHLQSHPFLVSDRYTIADIALFAYTHVAEEGNFSLRKYPAVRGWIDRIKAQLNYIPITQTFRS